jgi:hypothetical protein
MSTRLALTPAIGLFTGAMVSFGAVSMWLTGVHGSPSQATNPCTTTAAAQTTVGHRSVVRTTANTAGSSSQARHRPVLLDAFARAISAGPAGPHAVAASIANASTSSSPSPSPAPHPSFTPVTPNPTPDGGLVTPTPDATPGPGSSGISTPGSGTPTISPGGTNSTPTASPTPTPTATPTPTSTSSPPPTATLCLSVQNLGGSGTVNPDSTVQYAIVVWLTSGTGGSAKVSLTASRSGASPIFTICQPTGQSTCKVTGLTAGQHVEVQAQLTASDAASSSTTLTVSAKSAQAINSASATATVQVNPANSPSPSPSPTPTPNAGNGGTLPPVGLPGNNTTFPGVTNPAGNLGSAFPTVSPSPNAASAQVRHQRRIRTTDISAALPLTVRLVGGQVIGLAILAAAVTIAVARLSLRRQPPRHSDDSAGSTPAP